MARMNIAAMKFSKVYPMYVHEGADRLALLHLPLAGHDAGRGEHVEVDVAIAQVAECGRGGAGKAGYVSWCKNTCAGRNCS